MKTLDLNGTGVSDISALATLTQLKTLDLNGTGVSDISVLATLTKLERLYLNGTGVSDVSALANLTKLERLDLSDTGFSDISALANLTKLWELDLRGTGVSDVSALANLTKLWELDLRGCPLSHASRLTHIPALQAKGVNVEFVELHIHIPDTNLANAIRGGLRLGEGTPITLEKMRVLERLTATSSNRGIADLTGLEYATQLEVLGLNFTGFSDISVLANLTKLKTLHLGLTNVSDVSVLANLTKLEVLGLGGTNVSDVSVLANLTKLKTLDLVGTGVSDISALATLTQLEVLDLRGTGVSDISALANLTQLKTLHLVGTGVSDISALANLTILEWLNLSDTNVSDISALATLTQLQELSLNRTAVSDISALATLTQLQWLYLSDTNVSDISALATLTQLQSLSLNRTGVSDVSALATLPQLRALYLFGCPLSQASLHTHIPALEAKGIYVRFGERQEQELEQGDIHIPDTNLVNAIRKRFGEIKERFPRGLSLLRDGTPFIGERTRITAAAMSVIGLLEAPGKGIADLTGLEYAIDLTLLDLGGRQVDNEWRTNPIEDISALANLTQLRVLNLHDTNVSDVSVLANLTILGSLDLRDTGVSDVSALANLTKLQWLSLHDTNVSDVSVLANLTQLEVLDLYGTNVSDVSVLANLTKLEWLNLHDTNVSDVSVLANLTKLETLDLRDTDVSDISALAHLTQLEWLNLRGCPLNYASLYTHIPALQAKGIRVYFTEPVGCGTLMPWNLEPLRPAKIEPITRKRQIVSDGDFQGATVKFAPGTGTTRAWTTNDTVANDDKVGAVVITASITGATAAQRRKIKRAAADWSLYGNFYFRFVGGSDEADLRIHIDPEMKGNSGKATVGASSDSEMTLSEGFSYGVCLHEFGHVLGLNHEQVSPKFKELVDWAFEEEKLIPKLKTHGRENWTDEEIRRNILTVHEVGEAAKFDPDSIMVYNMNKGLVKVRPDAPDPTLAHKIAAEGIDIVYDSGLSADDKGLLKHIYGSPTLRAVVGGSISIEGVDDEPWPLDDEKINRSGGFGPQVFNSVDEYYLAREGPVAEFKWGGECRVEVYLSSRKIVEGSHIEMAANVFFFEGTTEDTRDIDDFRCLDFDIPLTGSEEKVRLKLENKRRTLHIDTRVRACRDIDIDVNPSTLSLRGDVLGGGDWAEVTLSLSAKTFDVEALKDLPGAAAPSAAAVKHRPSQEISDVNGDGQVTVADLVLVSKHIGQTDPSDSRVDLNADGIVTIVDLVQVARHLGSSTDPAAPAHIVAPKGLAYETVEGWLAGARAADDGSRLFLQGITNLERLLLLIIPEETVLLHNYPNPFNPETWIPYHLAEAAEVTLTIYTVDGTVVRTLALGHQSAGFYQSRSRAAYWDGRNAAGEPVASGVYFYTLSAGNFSATRKMVIRK